MAGLEGRCAYGARVSSRSSPQSAFAASPCSESAAKQSSRVNPDSNGRGGLYAPLPRHL